MNAEFVFSLLLYSVGATILLVPSIVALRRKVCALDGVFLTNVLFAWTGIGWWVAMCWACWGKTQADEHRQIAREVLMEGEVPS